MRPTSAQLRALDAAAQGPIQITNMNNRSTINACLLRGWLEHGDPVEVVRSKVTTYVLTDLGRTVRSR